MIDRTTAVTEDIFKKICKDKKMATARLTRGKLQAFLSRRYKGSVAKVITYFFDFSTPYEYESWIDEIESFLNFKSDILKKIAF